MKSSVSVLPRRPAWLKPILLGCIPACVAQAAAPPHATWRIHEFSRPRPEIVSPATPSTQERPGRAPSDAIVLFEGTDASHWVSLDGAPPKWVVKDGSLECVKGSGYVRTLQNFGDCQLHIEWAAPVPAQGTGQARGNSGVFLMGLYEVQVLDSYENITYADGQTGSAYGQHPPQVNASLPPGQWQTYDLIFTRPRFDAGGKLLSPARLTLLHNGVLVQNNVEFSGPTGWMSRTPYSWHPEKLPLALQDHGNPVRFRNIWIRDLEASRRPEFTFSAGVLDRCVGLYRVDDTLSISISRPGSHLVAELKSPSRTNSFTLQAESHTSFFVRHVDAAFSFQADGSGPPKGLTFRIGGEDRPAKRVP